MVELPSFKHLPASKNKKYPLRPNTQRFLSNLAWLGYLFGILIRIMVILYLLFVVCTQIHGYLVCYTKSPCWKGDFIHIRPNALEILRYRNGLKHNPAYRHVGTMQANAFGDVLSNTRSSLQRRWSLALQDMKKKPWTYISIPIVAALVGYITNYVGVKMLFYPIKWRGIPLYRWENQPLGLIGWQGIVPAKRFAMATKMVDVTITRLISVPAVFGQLEPRMLARLLAPTVSKVIAYGLIPSPLIRLFLRKTAKDMIKHIESVVDIGSLVVSGMTKDERTLGSFFMKVGAKELKFLIDSGFGFGFLLGILQMFQWMLFPANWTLPVGGAVVGYITNWIALKWIFEPILPTKVGPFVLQGMFLRRQPEVSAEFSQYIANNVLNSQRVWNSILEGPKADQFKKIVSRNVPMGGATVLAIVKQLREKVGQLGVPDVANHPIHGYTDAKLALEKTLVEKMNKMTPAEFEQVLHPIFQEDELTLILAGGVLGGLAGLLQWWINALIDKRIAEKQNQPKTRTDISAVSG